MKVTVRLGEPLWRQVGRREVEMDVPASTRVCDLLGEVATAYPALRPWLDGSEVPPMVFLDEVVADPATLLREGARPMLTWALAGG